MLEYTQTDITQLVHWLNISFGQALFTIEFSHIIFSHIFLIPLDTGRNFNVQDVQNMPCMSSERLI